MATILSLSDQAPAQMIEGAPLRLGTGGEGGTYYPVGSALAESWSIEMNACGEACWSGPFVAVSQFSNGSVSNVEGLIDGSLEMGLVQADVAYWARTGTGVFTGREPREDLRAVASLFSESLQIVVEAEHAADDLRGLEGLRISLDDRGSGTLVVARTLLDAYGMNEEDDLDAAYMKPANAIERMRADTLDGFILVAGTPTESIAEIAAERPVRLVPVGEAMADRIAERHPYFATSTIPADTYTGVEETLTLSVSAQLLVREDLDESLVYDLTRLLWSEATLDRLASSHAKGEQIVLSGALSGVVLPLHPGAERFYREKGMIN